MLYFFCAHFVISVRRIVASPATHHHRHRDHRHHRNQCVCVFSRQLTSATRYAQSHTDRKREIGESVNRITVHCASWFACTILVFFIYFFFFSFSLLLQFFLLLLHTNLYNFVVAGCSRCNMYKSRCAALYYILLLIPRFFLYSTYRSRSRCRSHSLVIAKQILFCPLRIFFILLSFFIYSNFFLAHTHFICMKCIYPFVHGLGCDVFLFLARFLRQRIFIFFSLANSSLFFPFISRLPACNSTNGKD